LGVLPWSPLYAGFLTGKFRKDKPKPQGTRRSGDQQFLQIGDDAKAYAILEALEKIAADHEASIAQAALNYLLRKPVVSSVIIGARTSEQLKDNLKASDWVMTPEEVATLDNLSTPPRVYPYWFIGGQRAVR
jgi:aryl-alcohol dehydrogenase-like predicted oxidoreductase